MFANRRSSQKPNEVFYAQFKQSFPEVGPGTSSAEHGQGVPVTSQLRSTSIDAAVVEHSNVHRYVHTSTLYLSSVSTSSPCPQHNTIMGSHHSPDHSDEEQSMLTDDYFNRPVFDNVDDSTKETGTTPKPFSDWRLTPSLMDPNSYAFAAFANQPPGYYTPTPGGFNTLWHSSAAGDLHTPGALGMNTPLSLPQSMHAMHASDPTMHFGHFNPQMLHPQQAFQDAFHPHSHHQQQHLQSQHNYAPPGLFLQHQDSGYVAVDDSSKGPTPNQDEMQSVHQKLAPPPMQQHDSGVSMSAYASSEKYVPTADFTHDSDRMTRFRYHTTLNAPTAMVRSSDEIPVTYLNKGQAYTMSIYDALPSSGASNVRYRTYVRIGFEDEQQRARPGACWQLWREGRGSNEAHQRGGKLLAVEYVDPNQGGDDETRKPQIELERASFDGFVVNWFPNIRANGVADCSISVRFNFLSTDFSHSKGVKGIPVRLCAKTELLTQLPDASNNEPEVCFAKVKLFRDHGAERKLSNDIAHVKKSIDKLKQQIQQAEAGMGTIGKRKRSGSMAKGAASRSKLSKHKRSWSADSDAEAGRISAEEDLHMKLAGLQDMFSSTRPMSVLYLKGDPEDDPDLCPVKLTSGDDIKPIERTKTWDSRQSGSESGSNAGSPTPSSLSASPKRKLSELQHSVIPEEGEDWEKKRALLDRSASPERPAKMIKREPEGAQTDLYALDVDNNYQPPPDRPIKPVACFYVKDKDASKPYYRAVYLLRRTVKDLVNGISEKFNIDPNRVTQVTHMNLKGLNIIVDEDVVREVPEGQDMVVEFAPVGTDKPGNHGLDLPLTMMADGDLPPPDTTTSDPLEMWLNF
ncbi:hypothetical protein LTR70_001911 [Exophiala xenobiotica]|uniref:Grh/CP2 DB domain-containing protein n=1 Tax=Lithohypha guttulata TaxID=1690604 RepID=A0ABR0K9T4_9EURO|nr:hypothetical protein LTR24_005087 [Lithohypha guttulata]KAK5326896.1 hypothetical protein LTR70_001911 [Exophiala xenobiotica]